MWEDDCQNSISYERIRVCVRYVSFSDFLRRAFLEGIVT
jgi:hypothetical protein